MAFQKILAIPCGVEEGLGDTGQLKSSSHRSGGPSSFQQLLSIPLVLHRRSVRLGSRISSILVWDSAPASESAQEYSSIILGSFGQMC